MKKSLSLNILACNEERSIGYTLESVMRNNLERPFELNLIANGCNDKTVDIAKSVAGEKLNVYRLEEASKPKAWNYAVRSNTSAYTGFMDADVIISSNSLESMCKELDKDEEKKVTIPKKIADYSCSSPFMKNIYDVYHLRRGRTMVNGALYIGRRELFEKMHPMPDIIGDDLYVSLNILDKEIKEVNEAKVIWKEPANAYDFVKLRRRIECSRLQLKNKSKEYKSQHRFNQWGNRRAFLNELNKIGPKGLWIFAAAPLFIAGKILGYSKYCFQDKAWERTPSSKEIDYLQNQ